MTQKINVITSPTQTEELKTSNYRRRLVKGKHNRDGNYELDVYDFKGLHKISGVTLKFMEHKKHKNRTVLIQPHGNGIVEAGVWLNLFGSYRRKNKRKDGTITYASNNPWFYITKKGKGIDAAFDNESFPDYHDGDIPSWMEKFLESSIEEFGSEDYAVTPFACHTYNKTPIPYVGISVSECGLGNDFLLMIGHVQIKGTFSASDSSFGHSEDSMMIPIGEYSIYF